MEAAAWHQLGKVHHRLQQSEEAERHYREAARMCQEQGHHAAAAQTWNDLAELLQSQPGRLGEARQLAEHAVTAMQSLDPAAPEVWRGYGILGDIAEREAQATEASDRRAALETDVRDYREVQRHAPVLFAALDGLGPGPGHGRAVILGQLGRTFQMGRRPDLAVRYLREAVDIAADAPAVRRCEGSAEVRCLRISDTHSAPSVTPPTRKRRMKPRSKSPKNCRTFEGRRPSPNGSAGSFKNSSSGAGNRTSRSRSTRTSAPTTSSERICSSTARVNDGSSGGSERRIPWPATHVQRCWGCAPGWTTRGRSVSAFPRVIRSSNDIQVAPSCGGSTGSWRSSGRPCHLAADPGMDGTSTVEAILSRLTEGERPVAAQLLAVLGATGAIDVSGRAVGRFLHLATKKGVLPAGGLEGDAVLQLATDGSYRSYPTAPRIVLGEAVPDRLRPFHTLTRARRSSRDYRGLGLSRVRFRCAAPHGVRRDGGDAVGGT